MYVGPTTKHIKSQMKLKKASEIISCHSRNSTLTITKNELKIVTTFFGCCPPKWLSVTKSFFSKVGKVLYLQTFFDASYFVLAYIPRFQFFCIFLADASCIGRRDAIEKDCICSSKSFVIRNPFLK